MRNLKCLTLNVRGIRKHEKRISIYQYLESKNINIAFLQETYCTKNIDIDYKNGCKYQITHSLSNSVHSRGVCTLINLDCEYKVINKHHDNDGRKLLVNIMIDDEYYTFVNVYCPNQASLRIQFLKKLSKWINKNALSKQNIIIGGDFNCAENMSDRNNHTTDRSSKHFTNFRSSLDLVDAWRHKNVHSINYTYIEPGTRGYKSRIDYLMTSEYLSDKVNQCTIWPSPAPDHKAVLLDIDMSQNKRGLGYWKLNTEILDEDAYKDGVNHIFQETMAEYGEVSKQLIWELCKIRIKEFSIRYSVDRKRRRVNKINVLEKQIDEIDKIDDDGNNMHLKRKLLLQELNHLYLSDAKGAQIRSRARYIEHGEKSSKFFLSLEKHRQKCNTITSLKTDNNTYTTDKDILDCAATFYGKLYQSTNPCKKDIDNYLKQIKAEKKLSVEESNSCDGKISYDECKTIIKLMKDNRAPGLDGISVEFYKTFWHIFGELIVASYNEAYDNGSLSESQKCAVISLIFKKGNKQDIGNYRPISLTNVDYKILAFVLANRIQNVIKSIINPSQVAYIKGRYIGCNIRLIEDLIELCDKEEKGGILMMLDFRKAFDSLEWDFLFKTLKYFNFSDSFIKWIQTLYKDPVAYIKNNGHLSKEIEIYRGIRQGCPVSALLFIIATEIMALAIRQNSDIQGFKVDENIIKILQYADDGTLLLKTEDEMKIAVDIISQFGKLAGTKLNLSKCEGLWLGNDKYRQQNCNLLNIKWPNEPIRCLGIFIGHNIEQKLEYNWKKRIKDIETLLDLWKSRDLTLFGKVAIIKSLAIPKIIYPGSVLTVPEEIIKQLNKLFYTFIWGKRDKIQRNVAIADIENGGLNMTDLESFFDSLKVTWVSRILNATAEDQWASVAKKYIKSLGPENLILKLNTDKIKEAHFLGNMPKFYQEMIVKFNKTKIITSQTFKDYILDQPIWGNKFIMFKKYPLFYKNWIDVNLIKLSNLKFTNGQLDEYHIYNKLKVKANIFQEISILKKALLPYKHIIGTHNAVECTDLPLFINADGNHINDLESAKAKPYYNILVNLKICKPVSEQHWRDIFRKENIDFKTVYTNKIRYIKDKKIAEFNFKVLHQILPCNVNLFRWKKKMSDLCDICNIPETIEHELYYCNKVRNIWQDLNTILDIDINIENIVLGLNIDKASNFALSLIAFYVYKDWLLKSLKNENQNKTLVFESILPDIISKYHIYKAIGWDDICNKLCILILSTNALGNVNMP